MPAGRRPSNIKIPGLSSKTGVQARGGIVLVGRVGGLGALQILTDEQLRAAGVKTPSNNSLAHQAGFTFSTDGIPADNQFIGRGVWSRDIHFHNSDANNVVTALSGATGTPSFRMLTDGLVQLGTIQFTTPTRAVVTWASDPYIHIAGQGMLLYAPTPADTTLGRVSGRVVGYI